MIGKSSLAAPRPAHPLRPGLIAWALPRLTLALALLLAAWLGLAATAAAPAVVPASAPASAFSAERAMRDLAVVAAAPHPVGSPQQAAVRDYLVAEVRALGLEPEVQRATLTRWSHRPGIAWTTAVENVLVRVPGTDSSRAILVDGHYDSAPTSAGAADCGACAATALEALRAIVAGPPLKNDVIFLFSDGEEVFIAGATAFAEQHPWMQDVGLSLVFEGVGTEGASMLYATSPANGWWVEQAVRAAPHPLAFSFLNDLMWRLAGNSGSDLDAFIGEGRAGLAFVTLSMASAPAYHTLADSVGAIDPRSVQHHGSHAVSLLRHFGNLPLDAAPRAANAVAFPLAPGVVARYPGAWALPLALLALAGFAAVVALGLWRRRLSVGGLLAGVLATLLHLVAAVVIATLAWSAIRRFNPDLHGFTAGGWYGGVFYLLALLLLTLAAVAALHALWRRRVRLDNLAVGALAWWLLFAVLTAAGLTGFSAMFTWPLLAALAALGWRYARPAQGSWAEALRLGAPVAVGLLLLAPAIMWVAFFAARLEGMLGAPLAAAPIPFAVLLIGLALPLAEFLAPGRPLRLPLGALALCLVALAVGTVQSRPDARRPIANTVAYELDADRGEAAWVALNDSPAGAPTAAELDVWAAQFFPAGGEASVFMPWRNGLVSDRLYPALRGPAPALDLPSSEVHVLADSAQGGARQLRLEVRQPAGVLTTQVIVSADGPLQALAANGTPLDLAGQPPAVQVSVIGRHAGGVTLDVTIPAGALTVTVQDQRPGLPAVPGLAVAPRPPWMVPAPLADVADSTLVRRTVRI